MFLEKLPKGKWVDEYKTLITEATEDQINTVKEIRDNEERTKEDVTLSNEIIKNWKCMSLSNYFKEHNIPRKEQDDFKYKYAWKIIQIVTLTGGARDIAIKEKQNFRSIPEFFCVVTPRKKMYLIKGSFNNKTKRGGHI